MSILAYELRLGVPQPSGSAFMLDPEVEEETIRTLGKPRVVLRERGNASVMLRGDEGRPSQVIVVSLTRRRSWSP